jgi:hypothetical protein
MSNTDPTKKTGGGTQVFATNSDQMTKNKDKVEMMWNYKLINIFNISNKGGIDRHHDTEYF